MQVKDISIEYFKKIIPFSKDYLEFVKNQKLNNYEAQNNNYDYDEPNKELLDLTLRQLDPFFKEVGIYLGYKKYGLVKAWIQHYEKGHFHDLHTHESIKDFYSFSYIIDCTEDSSHLNLYNPGYPYLSYYAKKIKPEIGLCTLFPCFLPHSVDPNKDNVRLIVSGNIKWQK